MICQFENRNAFLQVALIGVLTLLEISLFLMPRFRAVPDQYLLAESLESTVSPVIQVIR
ncbi:MAG: hypothetical protein GY768_27130 [Planctomycetaceae bacterium]|nr:hypothetical protein [Planctomycetaceae bacterium]